MKQELVDEIVKKGLTNEQALSVLHTVRQWLEENYPVAGTLAGSWLKDQGGE